MYKESMGQYRLIATDGGKGGDSPPDTSNMETVVIVGCGNEKADATVAAKDLYTSTYFAKKREYAETIGDSWAILSAKYCSLDPSGARVAPYDLTISDYPIDSEQYPDAPYTTIDEWAADFLSGVENRAQNYERWDDHDPLGELVMLVGQAYLAPLRERLDELAAEYGFEIVLPFEGMSGNGEQMQWLGEQVAQDTMSSAEGGPNGTGASGIDTDRAADNERNGDGATENEGDGGQRGLDSWS